MSACCELTSSSTIAFREEQSSYDGVSVESDPERKFHPQKTHHLAEASQAFEMFLARQAAAFAGFV
jgi:hypothetical protein